MERSMVRRSMLSYKVISTSKMVEFITPCTTCRWFTLISNKWILYSIRSLGSLAPFIVFQIRSKTDSLLQVLLPQFFTQANRASVFLGGVVNRSALVRIFEADNTTEQSIFNIEQYFRGIESGVLYVDTFINGSLPHPEGNLSVSVANSNIKYIKRSSG